jgi:hypothetical protein
MDALSPLLLPVMTHITKRAATVAKLCCTCLTKQTQSENADATAKSGSQNVVTNWHQKKEPKDGWILRCNQFLSSHYLYFLTSNHRHLSSEGSAERREENVTDAKARQPEIKWNIRNSKIYNMRAMLAGGVFCLL